MHSRILAAASAILLFPMLLAAGESGSIADRTVGGNRPMGRHLILEVQRPLSESDLADLAGRGVTVQKPVSGGRYLIVVEPDSTFDASDPRVRSLEPLTAAKKLQPSAYREVARSRAFARLQVDFHKDVSIEEARQAIVDAGGAPTDLLRTRFGVLRRLEARIPAASVGKLAADERVLSIYGGPPLRAELDNATAAVMSNVTPLFSSPYGLSGSGVILSLFELGPADATHNEFGNRLTVHGTYCTNCSDFVNHATHVSGTLIATGLSGQAKGMAPNATLHEFKGGGANWLDDKDAQLPIVKSVADNNSWGYVLGWRTNSNTGWTWTGNDEYIGGYDSTDSAIDEIARAGTTLMIHSAGNEGDNGGPTAAPFQHEHENDNGDVIPNEIFCYSANGSGNDCPSPCTATPGHCEITRHPVHVPFGSIGLTPGSKNVIAVGALDNFKNILSFSSRGPTRDGRVKPDVVAKGYNLYSTFPNNGYARSSGTSMSSPVVTGLSALIVEQYRKTFGGASPSPQVLKTLVLAGADDLGRPGIDYTFGYGLADAKASVDLVIADGGSGKRIKVDSAIQGSQIDYPLTLTSGQNLRVVLAWQDPEVLNLGDNLAGSTLVNDLDLKVTGPGGTVLPYVLDMNNPDSPATRGVNTVDNNEEVEITGATAGTYHILVSGTRITAASPQKFVLVSNADISTGVVIPPCVDPTEPNETLETAYGPLASATPVLASLCSATDTDIFRFSSSGSGGQVKAAVTTTVALHLVLLSSSGSELASTDVAAGASGQVTATAPSGTQQYFIRITPNGTATGTYTVTATYPFSISPRRRTAR